MTLIIGSRVDDTSYSDASELIISWAVRKESRYVCHANVHVLMEAYDASNYRRIINSSDLTTPDGMPLVWMMRLKGNKNQSRVYGPTLMLHVLESAASNNIPVGFYGGSEMVLHLLVEKMQKRFSRLKIVYAYSPPFRELAPFEDKEIVDKIKTSGARILFVGLGCPKQEIWMADHHKKISSVMLGVGAAFDFHAGVKSQAPVLLQYLGLEWLFRFFTEPRRLWRRYLYNNPRFIYLSFWDLLN